MRVTPPCLNCPNKTQGCHGKCNKYKAYCAVHEVEKKAIKEAAKSEKEYIDYCASVNKRFKKHRGG